MCRCKHLSGQMGGPHFVRISQSAVVSSCSCVGKPNCSEQVACDRPTAPQAGVLRLQGWTLRDSCIYQRINVYLKSTEHNEVSWIPFVESWRLLCPAQCKLWVNEADEPVSYSVCIPSCVWLTGRNITESKHPIVHFLLQKHACGAVQPTPAHKRSEKAERVKNSWNAVWLGGFSSEQDLLG